MSYLLPAPVSIVPLEILDLLMITSSSNIASASTYDLELGNPTVFDVRTQSGTSIGTDPLDTEKITLKAGLYQIIVSGWVQTNSTVYGDVDLQLDIATNQTFGNSTDVMVDRSKLWYGNGSSGNTTPIIDNSNSCIFNTSTDTQIYMRMKLTNAAGATWILRGDPAIGGNKPYTTVTIIRLGDAL